VQPVAETPAKRTTPWKAVVLVAVVVCLILTWVPRESTRSGSLTPAVKRTALQEIALNDLSGKPWTLAEHRGQVVLLNFWATWCQPCREETPGLVRIANSYASKGLAVLGVAMDDSGADAIRRFISEYRIGYPVALPKKDFLLAQNVDALPTTVLIDKKGRIAKMYVGGVSESAFRADIDMLLREPPNGD